MASPASWAVNTVVAPSSLALALSSSISPPLAPDRASTVDMVDSNSAAMPTHSAKAS